MSNDCTVIHNAAASRFECSVDDTLCVCEYRLHDGVMNFTSTRVPPEMGGRGIAAALVAAALKWARAQGLRVNPLCSYVATYLRRYADTQDLLVAPLA